MKQRRSHPLLLDLWACFVLPAYTLLFAGSVTWLGTNFSVLAVAGERYYRGFLLWGLLAGGYFLAVLWSLAGTVRAPGVKWAVRGLLLLSCGCLGVGLPLPYLPERFPGVAWTHTAMVMTSCVGMMGCLLVLLTCFRREDRTAYRPFFRGWLLIVGVCGALFLLAGIISTALEVFFTISTALLVRRLWLRRREF